MKTEFNTLYKALGEKREQLFSVLRNYSDDVLNQKPSAESWSVAEVIQHLMAADFATLRYLQKKTLDTSRSKNAGLTNKIRLGLLKLAFALPFKYKAPPVTTPKERSHLSLIEMDVKWKQIHDDTLSLINKLNDQDFKKELWLHPIGGKMNLFQMINFSNVHFDRHKEQIHRTLDRVK